MTQEELAKKTNVSKSAIAKWETDGGIPDRDNLYKLANILGVTVSGGGLRWVVFGCWRGDLLRQVGGRAGGVRCR